MIKNYDNFLNEAINKNQYPHRYDDNQINFTAGEVEFFDDLGKELMDPEWGEGISSSFSPQKLSYNLKNWMEIEPEVGGGYEERETEDLEILKLGEERYQIKYDYIKGGYGYGYEDYEADEDFMDIESEADWDYNPQTKTEKIMVSGPLSEIKPQIVEFVEKCRAEL